MGPKRSPSGEKRVPADASGIKLPWPPVSRSSSRSASVPAMVKPVTLMTVSSAASSTPTANSAVRMNFRFACFMLTSFPKDRCRFRRRPSRSLCVL